MWTAFAMVVAFLFGLVGGLFFGPNFFKEFTNFKIFLFGELAKLHTKLDSILAAVSPK